MAIKPSLLLDYMPSRKSYYIGSLLRSRSLSTMGILRSMNEAPVVPNLNPSGHLGAAPRASPWRPLRGIEARMKPYSSINNASNRFESSIWKQQMYNKMHLVIVGVLATVSIATVGMLVFVFFDVSRHMRTLRSVFQSKDA